MAVVGSGGWILEDRMFRCAFTAGDRYLRVIFPGMLPHVVPAAFAGEFFPSEMGLCSWVLGMEPCVIHFFEVVEFQPCQLEVPGVGLLLLVSEDWAWVEIESCCWVGSVWELVAWDVDWIGSFSCFRTGKLARILKAEVSVPYM